MKNNNIKLIEIKHIYATDCPRCGMPATMTFIYNAADNLNQREISCQHCEYYTIENLEENE